VKIVMTGIRGVPARYSGLETCAEEVGRRLVARGHEVIVYCRKHAFPPPDTGEPYLGMRRIILPSIKTKHMDTYSHTFLSLLHAPSVKPDVLLVFNPGNATLCLIPKLLGMPVALNPDGFDWKRQKWNQFVRFFIQASAWFSTKIVDQLVTDAVAVCEHYNDDFRCTPPAVYIPNGAPLETPEDSPVPTEEAAAILRQYGLESGRYILFLSRHEPENSCDLIIKAFEGLDTPMKLFFGGGVTYQSSYAERLHDTKDPRIMFPGPIYEPLHVKVLHHHCYLLINGNQPGGTSLGLLKAMGYGTCVVTVNTPDNAYATRNAGLTFELSPESLRDILRRLLDHPEEVQDLRRRAVARIREEYLWDDITLKYEEVFLRIAKKRPAQS
jgi:glycosyltransferase involved in cell wall biosynthesis